MAWGNLRLPMMLVWDVAGTRHTVDTSDRLVTTVAWGNLRFDWDVAWDVAGGRHQTLTYGKIQAIDKA